MGNVDFKFVCARVWSRCLSDKMADDVQTCEAEGLGRCDSLYYRKPFSFSNTPTENRIDLVNVGTIPVYGITIRDPWRTCAL